MVPICGFQLKIAIVPGNTPFLISNTLLRALKASIDVEEHTIWSKLLQREFPMQLSPRGLFLIDLNDLAAGKDNSANSCGADTHLAACDVTKVAQSSLPDLGMQPNSQHQPNPNPSSESSKVSGLEDTGTPNVAPSSCDVRNSQRTDAVAKSTGSSNLIASSSCDTNSKTHVVVGAAPEANPSASRGGEGRFQSPVSRGDESDGHRLRSSPQGKGISDCVADRSGLDHVVCGKVPELPEDVPSSVCALCEQHAGPRRTARGASAIDHGSDNRHNQCDHHATDTSSKPIECHSQGQGTQCSSSHDAERSELRLRTGTGGCIGSHCHGPSAEEHQHPREPCGQYGDSHAEHPAASGDADCTDAVQQDSSSRDGRAVGSAIVEPDLTMHHAGEVIDDMIHHASHVENQCKERLLFQHLIKKLELELDQVRRQVTHHKIRQPSLKIFEIFCSSNSQITLQGNNLGFPSRRFGLEQGNLETVEGRRSMFTTLISRNPEHVWYSPVCGPWSGWSSLNGSQSMTAFDQLQARRLLHLEQVALGIVLLRYQRSQERHFHWEQPKTSLMLKLPYLEELHAYTRAASFDMCTAGDLKDPVNNKHYKKGMTVMTTSKIVADHLEKLRCSGQHEHQTIEGSIYVYGQRMNRSAFSENYPRKFARQIVRVMCQLRFPREKPLLLLTEAFATSSSEPLPKRRRLTVVKRPAPAKCTEVTTDTTVKRRKLNGKQTPMNALEQWTQVFDLVDGKLPRVGRIELTDDNILQMAQDLIHDKQIKRVIARRGANRTIGPPKDLTADEAPYRKCVFLKRGTKQIFMEDKWESWGELSQRQLVRPSHSCRINITMFAGDPEEMRSSSAVNSGAPQDEVTQDDSNVPDINSEDPKPDTSSSPRATDMAHAKDSTDQTNNSSHDNNNINSNSNTKLNLFQHLAKDEQSLIWRSHQNLGHPSPEKLSTILRQQGYRPEICQAALQLQCPTCVKHSLPKSGRTGSLRDDSDFNDRIAIDGVSWTNSKGQSFHFYHVIDWSTNFHAASIAPSKTSENMINAIGQMWLSWAGIPGEIPVDAGSEFSCEDFMTFLQSCNIRATTTSPEAHHQNGKIERHGAVLQRMLDKFDSEHTIASYKDLQQALWWCIQAKNANSIRRGFAPEVLVLGKHTRLPGSITSDSLLPAHALADSDTAQGLQFRQQLAYRECARRAFHSADNDAALRKALLRRSTPHRGQYEPGEWVMIWKPHSSMGNVNQGMWVGPMKVILQEGQHTLWATMSSKLFRAAPENVRPVTSCEAREITVRPNEPSVSEVARHIPARVQGDITQYHNYQMPNLSNTSTETTPSPPTITPVTEIIPTEAITSPIINHPIIQVIPKPLDNQTKNQKSLQNHQILQYLPYQQHPQRPYQYPMMMMKN